MLFAAAKRRRIGIAPADRVAVVGVGVLLHDRIAGRQELGVGGALAGVALVTIAS